MIGGDDYINTSPSTAEGEQYMIRTVFAISVRRGVHFFRAQIPVELGSQERGSEEILGSPESLPPRPSRRPGMYGSRGRDVGRRRHGDEN